MVVCSHTCNEITSLTPGGCEVKSEGAGTAVPGVVLDVVIVLATLPGIYQTTSWSYYPGHARVVIRTPAPAVTPGTTSEFVGKGIETDPRVTGNPAPYPVGVLSAVL